MEYGLEQLIKWKEVNLNKTLLILSGTDEEDLSLNELSCLLYTSPSPRD